MQYVIIDTSSILFSLSFRKDAFSIAERRFHALPLISKGVIRELRGISTNRGKKGQTARTALSLIRVKKVKVDNDNGNVDSWVYRTAAKGKACAVVTNDTALFRRVKLSNRNVFKLSKNGLLKR